MAARASWKGQLKISLVSFPVCLYNAISSASRISMNQLHRGCNRRLKQQMICPEHGPVGREDIVKGYEYEKDRYVIVEDEDLEKIKLETNKTIDIVQFINGHELDPLFYESPYYVGPDGPVAEEAFRVIREALKKSGKIGIGRVVMSSREQVVALKPEGRGFLLCTLRSTEEVRQSATYFEDIRNGDVSKDQLTLAEQLIESKAAPLDTTVFRDRYQDSLLAIIKAKIEGSEPVMAPEEEAGTVINLMDALRQSLAQTKKKPAAASVKAPAAKKERKAKRA